MRSESPGSTMDDTRRSTGRRNALWWFLPPTAAVLILFGPTIGRNRIHFFEDIPNGTYPMRVFLAESLRKGTLPLWCPYIYCGYPLLAEGQTGTFYPTNALLFLTLPNPTAFELSLLLHYLLAAGGMFLFLGAVGLSPPARSIGATAFALSGYMTARLAYINLIQVAAWLPWLLLAAGRVARSGSWRWGGVLAGVIAAQLFAGHPQTCVYCFLAAVVWFAASLRDTSRKARAVGVCAAAVAVSFMIAAVQLLPTLELVLQSRRQGGLALDEAGLGSMQPGWFVTWVFPYFFGLSEPDRFVFPGFPGFWGGTCFWELCAYAGVVPLVLALFGATKGRSARIFVGLAVAGIVLALGKYSPLFPLLQRVPVLGWFRLPARALLLTTFALSALAGIGLDAVTGLKREGHKLLLILAALIACSLAVFPLTRLALKRSDNLIAAKVSNALDQRKVPPADGEDLWRDYHPTTGDVLRQIQQSTRLTAPYNSYFLILLIVVSGLVAALAYGRLSGRSAALVLLLLSAGDLCVFGVRYNPALPARSARTPPEVLRYLRRPDGECGRTWASNDTFYFLSDYHRTSPPRRDRAPDPWPEALELLPTNYNVLWGVESPMGRTPLPLRSFHRLQQWMEHNTLQTTAGVLDLCNVRSVISYRPLNSLRPIAEGKNWHLYARPKAFPRAFVLPDSCGIPKETTLDEVLDGSLPLRGGILSRQPEWSARVTSYAQHDVTVVAKLDGPGTLVLTDAWYPGWQALVDGSRVRLDLAYGLFRSVHLGPGRHAVQFRYDPRSLRVGALISLLGVGALVASVAPGKRRRI